MATDATLLQHKPTGKAQALAIFRALRSFDFDTPRNTINVDIQPPPDYLFPAENNHPARVATRLLCCLTSATNVRALS
ncbi:MAG TPA: hypothetical protein VF656_04390 [Pyrinomonadaceae bacterium]|jgi:hypothetical protein